MEQTGQKKTTSRDVGGRATAHYRNVLCRVCSMRKSPKSAQTLTINASKNAQKYLPLKHRIEMDGNVPTPTTGISCNGNITLSWSTITDLISDVKPNGIYVNN